MGISKFDNYHKVGLTELGLKAVVCVVGLAISVVVGFAVFVGFFRMYPEAGEIMLPSWVIDYAHKFARGEWLVFLMALEMHNRTMSRAIRFGPITGRVVLVSLFWPMALSAVVTLTLSLAFWFTFKSTSWWLMPQVAQFGVWVVWEQLVEAYFKYMPNSPTSREITRSF